MRLLAYGRHAACPLALGETTMTTFAFGIELELAHPSIADVQRAFTARGIEGCEIKPDATPGVTAEIALPPLAPSPFAWRYVSEICDTLASIGARVSTSCGFHVHVSNAPLADGISAAAFSRRSIEQRHTAQTYIAGPEWFSDPMDAVAVRDIVARYHNAQHHVDTMHPASRRGNRYALPFTSSRFAAMQNARTVGDMAAAQGSKFCAVNVLTWTRGTIEFRQAAGTVELEKIKQWALFVTNLVRWTYDERMDRSATVTTTHTTPDRPYRAGSRLDVIWRACRQPGGAHVRDLMDATGTSAQNIRSRISEMRAAHGDEAVITHTQQENGHSYGDGIDLTRYEIRSDWTTTQHGAAAIRDNALTSIWAGLDDDAFEWWQQRIEALAA